MLEYYFPSYFPNLLQGYSVQSEAMIATFHMLADALFTRHPIIPGSTVHDTSSVFKQISRK